MMAFRTILILTLFAALAAVLMSTVIAVPEDLRDFAAGLAGGLAIGTIVTWFTTRQSPPPSLPPTIEP
jgi:preprotein translocase subunit SecF